MTNAFSKSIKRRSLESFSISVSFKILFSSLIFSPINLFFESMFDRYLTLKARLFYSTSDCFCSEFLITI